MVSFENLLLLFLHLRCEVLVYHLRRKLDKERRCSHSHDRDSEENLVNLLSQDAGGKTGRTENEREFSNLGETDCGKDSGTGGNA